MGVFKDEKKKLLRLIDLYLVRTDVSQDPNLDSFQGVQINKHSINLKGGLPASEGTYFDFGTIANKRCQITPLSRKFE